MQVNPICQNLIICKYKSLHALPKFASSVQRVQVGNGQCVALFFVTQVIIDV